MRNKFKAGDTVRCIDDTGRKHMLKNGKTYLVEKIHPAYDRNLVLAGVDGSHQRYRFELVGKPKLKIQQ